MSDIKVGIKLTADGSGKVTAEITKITGGLSTMGKAGADSAAKVNSSFSATRKGLESISSQLDSARKSFLAFVSVQAAWSGVKQVTATADAWTNLNSRIRAVTGTQREFSQALADVSAVANQYKQDINEVGGAYSRFATAVQKLGGSQRDLRDILSATAAGLQLSGSSAGQAAGAMQQLGQALASPIVHAEELNSVFEGNLVLYNAIEKQLPNLVRQYGSLKNAVNEQALTNQDLANAIKAASVELENQAKVMQTTVAGALTVLSNEWEKYIGNADQASEGSRDLANGILSISRNLETIMTPVSLIVSGWGLIFEAIGKATEKLQSFVDLTTRFSLSDAFKALFSPSSGGPGQSRENYMSRYGVNPAISGSSNVGREIMRGAQQYIGYNETGPKKQELIDFLNKYSGTVFKDVAGDVNKWCARFVSAVLQQNGIQNPQSAAARSYAEWGQSVWKQGDGNKGLENLRPGDVAVFTRKGGAHVAFVDSIDAAKGTLNVLGGNQSNAVSIAERSIQDLIAVRRAPGGEAFGVAKNPQLDALTLATKGLTDIQRMIVQKAMAAKLDPLTMLGLAQRESQFNPNAANKDARGLWQFTTGTGKDYGLNSEADRKNVEKSTDAAIRMFKDLMVGLDGNLRHVLAAWNMGEKGVKRRLAQNQNPEDFTEGPHVQRILDYRQQWETKLGGKLASVMDAGDMKKNADAWKKLLDQQFDAYADHLKKLESQRDNANTVELSAQRVQMEKLEAQRAQIAQKDKQAIVNAQGAGNVAELDKAMQAAKQHEEQYLKDKQALLLKGMDLEQKSLEQRKAHIGQMIAEANKLKGQQLDKIPGLELDRAKVTADLQALANQRKEIEIKLNADLTANAVQAEDEKRKAQRQTADDYAQSVAERRQATEEEYRFFQATMDLQIDRAKSLAESRKADIDATLEQARAQASQADAARQAAMEGKTGMEAIAQASENVNAKLADSLRLIDLEKTATLDKLRIDGDLLASQRQLLEVYRAIAEQRGNRDDVLKTEQQLQAVYDAQTKNIRARVQAEMDAAGAAAKARETAGKSRGDIEKQATGIDEQSVKEAQLRMNAYWDQTISRVREYASLMEQITGGKNPWSDMAVSVMEYAKSVDQINAKYKDLQDAWRKQTGAGKDQADEYLKMQSALEQGQAAAAMMAQTMLAARQNTEKGSQAYDNLTSSAQGFMTVVQLLNIAEGINAVIKQLKEGDPYTAAIRAAGAAMMVASMGINTGFAGASGGGMSNRQAREAAQTGGSTAAGGGVFGDSSAKSESISKSLEIVAANSNANLAYSAGMLRSLKNIELALAGTTNAIIRGVKPADVQGLGQKNFNVAIDPLQIGKLIGSGVYTKITNWGIKALPQQLDQIIAKGFQGMNWTEVTKTTKILGITIGKSVKNIYGALDTGVAGQITRVIRNMADTVREAGKAFGISGEQFMSAMKGFTVNFGTLATKGLKGDELQKAVEQVFSSMSDDMAQQFQANFNLNLEPFMRAGEGMYQTLVRVADGINVASGMLEQAGLKAINYQDIILKQGDVAAEIIRKSIVAFEGATSAIGAYIDQAVGSAEELMQVYQDLLIVSDTAKLTGFNLNNLSNALIVTSGGVSKFLSNLQTYQTEILGSSDYARQMLTLQREFAKIGQAVPANNAAFVRLVNGIDTTTEAGQKLYAQVLALAGAFSKAQQEAAKLEELRAKYLPKDSMAEYRKQLEQVPKDFAQIIEGTLAGMKGGGTYLKRMGRITALTDLKTDRQDELALVNEDIAKLEAKGKLTQKEKQTLAGLRQQRKDLEAEIADTDKQIAKINKLIAANKNTGALIKERDKLIEEQGNAIIQTLADIWEKMTAAINAAKETLISIQNDIYELTFTAGSQDVKLGMATAKKVTAQTAYDTYTRNGGNDIEQLNKLASALHSAIMAEYQAQLDFIMAPKIALEKERDLAQKAHDEQIQALEKQLGVAKELFDAVKNIQDYAKSLRTSTAANLSPKKALDAAKAQYDELLGKAKTGDVDAMRKITGASDAYLEAARKYFGSGGKYGQIFDGIVSAMDALGMTNTGDAQSIQDKIDKLNADHALYLKGIDDKIAALNIDQKVKDLQMSTAADLDKLAKDLGPRIDAAALKAKQDMESLIGKVTEGNTLNAQQVEALNTMLKSWGMKPIEAPTTPTTGTTPGTPPGGSGNTGNTGKPGNPAKPPKPLNPADDPAKYDGPAAWKTWTDYWKQQQRILKNHPEWNKTWAQFKVEEFQRLQAQGMHPAVPAFAQGGLAQPGWALVGEEGPELVKFGSQAMVYDAEKTAKMLREIASFQPVMPQAPRPINLEIMPRLIDDMPKQGKPINLERMPRVINDLPRRDPDTYRLSNDEVIAELRAMRAELKALVTTQSRANPAVIEQLANIERRLGYMERDQKLKPA